MNIHNFADAEAVATAVANVVIRTVQQAVRARGICHLALAGGTTPRQCYSRLRQADLPWQALHIWFGDERCLPVGDDQRNDTMADAAWLHHVPIPAANIHRIAAESGAEQAALAYSKDLAGITIDLALLGMGEDGHTASLFPNHPEIHAAQPAVAVHHAPKLPADRVSMSLATLNAARQRLVMVTGRSKKTVWESIAQGDNAHLPVCQLHQPAWYIAIP